jgi:FMN phosphatase YigB (HAD superfamily)
MNLDRPQVIYLDWYHTLSASHFWDPLAQAHPEQAAALTNALFGALEPQLGGWMRGQTTCEAMLRQVAQLTHIDYDFVFAELVRGCQTMQFTAPEVPGLVAALRRRGQRVVIATDNMDTFTRFVVPAMGLAEMFDGVLNSYDLQALKDDFDASGRNLFFDDYLCKSGLAPAQHVLIDDSELTEETAARIGMGYLKVTPDRSLRDHLRTLLC